MNPHIVPIVEGFSETESVPILLRRILQETLRVYDVDVARPFRLTRTRVVRPGELERAIQLALADREGAEAILVLMDADNDCPATLAPVLAARCKPVCPKPFAVVLAEREFEGWFLGAKKSLRNVRGIRPDAQPPAEPEKIRGAKEELSRNMVDGRRYQEVDDQPALAAQMDLAEARSACASFDKLLREVATLVRHIHRP